VTFDLILVHEAGGGCLVFTLRLLYLQNGGLEYIKHEDPDILCLQETKCSTADIPHVCDIWHVPLSLSLSISLSLSLSLFLSHTHTHTFLSSINSRPSAPIGPGEYPWLPHLLALGPAEGIQWSGVRTLVLAVCIGWA